MEPKFLHQVWGYSWIPQPLAGVLVPKEQTNASARVGAYVFLVLCRRRDAFLSQGPAGYAKWFIGDYYKLQEYLPSNP